jgi:hypothetical protein
LGKTRLFAFPIRLGGLPHGLFYFWDEANSTKPFLYIEVIYDIDAANNI